MIEIDNKYNVGDTLWKMYENKPTVYNIDRITIMLTATKTEFNYTLKRQGFMCMHTYSEDQLDEMFYPTKEKCILSLFDK